MKMKFLTGLMGALMCITSTYGAAREIDYAIEDAAVKTIQELTDRNIAINNIAFVGLAADKGDLTATFRSGLLRVPGSYNFFTRDDKEFNILLSEIEFGDRRGDVMDQSTIKQFGKIQGVDALLYGKLQEATVEGTDGIVRVVMTLANVETGQLLWSGSITGTYTTPTPRENINLQVIEAAVDAGKKLAEKLAEKTNIPMTDVFLLPLVGKMSADLSDMLSTEVISSNQNQSLSFFSEPSAVNTNTVRNLSYKLAGEGSSGVSQVQLGKVLQQLEQMYNVPKSDKTGAQLSAAHRVQAYLIGSIMNVTEPTAGKQAKVTVTFKMRNCESNQIIAGGTVTGISIGEALTSNERLAKIWRESGLLIQLIIGGVSLCIAGIIFFLFIKMATGVR